MLSLYGEFERLLFAEILTTPKPLEQLEAEFAPDGFLDHFAVALAGAGAAYLDRPQYIGVDRERGTHLGHQCILAS